MRTKAPSGELHNKPLNRQKMGLVVSGDLFCRSPDTNTVYRQAFVFWCFIKKQVVKAVKSSYKLSLLETLLVIGFYGVLAIMYYTALWFNRGGSTNNTDPYFNPAGFLNWGGIDYLLKLVLSLPIWWLMFRRLRHLALYKRVLIHCVTLPLFVLVWQKLYYIITDHLHMFHLQDLGQVWDLYITALFYILAFGVMHAYVYFKENEKKQQTEAALRETALKSELSALKAQINPHFLYNVFNTINASIPAHMEETRQMIAELSDLFRYLLQASKAELVPLRDELEFTRKYLNLEKARFQERLGIGIFAEEGLLDEMVPPMLIQPLVENAVKHGIAPMIAGGRVTVQVKRQDGRIAFCISDTGMGAAGKSDLIGKGTGLTNTAMRLNKMFGTTLQFTDSLPHGLTINFIL